MTGRDHYHHGNLRNALVDAGLAILEDEGLNALTLRAAAARAGVSHAAPAHHFGSLRGLLTALATVAFRRLDASLASANAAGGGDADRLRASGAAYVAFATSNPALFRLMFSGADLDWENEPLRSAAAGAYARLSEVVAPVAGQRGAHSRADVQALELLVWSHVHGFAHLAIAGQLDRPDLAIECRRPPLPDLAALLLP
jgi:AcrR family transcriptional regulator